MPVVFSGPAQVHIGTANTTSGTASIEWALLGTTTGITGLTASLGQLTQVICCTTGSVAGFNSAWACGGTTGQDEPWLPEYNCPPEPEQLAARRERDGQARRRRDRAQARALELLMSVLDEDEARSYAEDGYIELRGSAGGWWRIRRGSVMGNVDELEHPGAERVATWCCHPPDGLPPADVHLAQLLQLATDEDGFRQTGNRTPHRRLPAAA